MTASSTNTDAAIARALERCGNCCSCMLTLVQCNQCLFFIVDAATGSIRPAAKRSHVTGIEAAAAAAAAAADHHPASTSVSSDMGLTVGQLQLSFRNESQK
jgi:hypothetical protein